MFRYIALLIFCASCFAQPSFAADDRRYVSDELTIPLRAGKSDSAKTINNNLTAGTSLKLLKEDGSSGFSLVETTSGTQGWVKSRYLTSELPAREKLVEMQQQLAQKDPIVAALQKDIRALKADNKRLTEQQLSTLQQLTELRNASGNVTGLMEQNRELVEKNQLLQSKVASLEAVKEKFQDSRHMDQFIYGGLLVIITLILSAVIDSIRRRRAYSSWS